MELLDEQEMLIQYSEMSAFDFNSEEFRKIRDDYMECKNFIQKFVLKVAEFSEKIRPVNA